MKEFAINKIVSRLITPVSGAGEAFFRQLRIQENLWPEIYRVAGDGLVTPSLGEELARNGQFSQLPADVRTYLDAIRQLNIERNETKY